MTDMTLPIWVFIASLWLASGLGFMAGLVWAAVVQVGIRNEAREHGDL